MREDEKQALIAYIGQLDRGETLFMPMRVIQELSESVRRVALASLMAKPVAWVTLQSGWEDKERTAITDEDVAREYSRGCYELTPLCVWPAPSVPTEPVSRGYTLPEGVKLVPVVPTDEMIAAGDRHMDGLSKLSGAWEAMLNAAPEVT